MKLASTWFSRGRGTALGVLLAALTLGSAFPHLISARVDELTWQSVIVATSVAALAGALLILWMGEEGPYPFARSALDPRHIKALVRNRALMLANLGYLGHMWELYAMWGWILAYIRAGGPGLGIGDPSVASLLAFFIVASGGIGSIAGGIVADRIGRTATAAAMMVVSAFCASVLAFLRRCHRVGSDRHRRFRPILGDGNRIERSTLRGHSTFPAAKRRHRTHFLLHPSGVIQAETVGWRWSFLVLAPGPLLGVVAMMALRRMPAARLIAHGLR
ncbi:MFS transporter [Mesorhizobium sp.]|uniref:MFS transporter n=1 Tax=Mesorhizobium sp. TaxID=1871066 RepID=UPI0034297482